MGMSLTKEHSRLLSPDRLAGCSGKSLGSCVAPNTALICSDLQVQGVLCVVEMLCYAMLCYVMLS